MRRPCSRPCKSLVSARLWRCVRLSQSGWHPSPIAGNWDDLRQFEDAKKKLEKEPGSVTPRLAHFCPQCGQFRGFETGGVKAFFQGLRGRDDAFFPKYQAFEEEA